MTDPNTTTQPADGAAYMELQDALREVITFPGTELVPGFATVNVKKEIHDNDGNTIPAQLHFMSKSGALYVMTIEGKTETGLKGQLVRYNATTGGAFTLSHLIELILSDKALSAYIDTDAAEKAMDKLWGATHTEPDNQIGLAKIPTITAIRTEKIEYPLDKINSNIWSLLTSIEPSGQIAFATEKRGSAKEATILYSINFDQLEPELSVIKKLTPFDKRCYIAAAALYNNGNPIISAAQIYAVMGNRGRPNTNDVQKINSSLTKMAVARVYINNEQEITVNKKYNRFVYDGPLLPFERVTAYINNQPCDAAIHLFREPPLVTFAKDRKQITTIPRKLLESPISKTNSNLRIDDYLIERISHIKNGRVKNRLLFATIYKQCGITEKKQRQRAPEKIRRYLDHYKNCGFIKEYSEESDGVTITY